MNITDLTAVEILDSRGNPTIQVTLRSDEATATAKVPSGASTGQYEAQELRDNDPTRYNGNGVIQAIKNINETIQSRVKNRSFSSQEGFDAALIDLDGTQNKARLGANAILGCSMAYARLNAKIRGEPLYASFNDEHGRLPTPYCNILNGGEHAGNDLTLQEFMIVPVTTTTFSEATRVVAETYHALKSIVEEQYGSQHTGVGDEGGFAPPVSDPEEAIHLIEKATKQAGHTDTVKIAIDAAANEFYNTSNETYTVDDNQYGPDSLRRRYEDLIEAHDIISLEDPFHDDDYEAFNALLDRVRDDCQIVGDDLTVSNPRRVEKAIDMDSANALLLKVNQIGTVTEAQRAADIAHNAGWEVMVSHRSGETCDAFIADFAVGIGAKQIKIGAPCRGERTAKYNRLLTIEQRIHDAV